MMCSPWSTNRENRRHSHEWDNWLHPKPRFKDLFPFYVHEDFACMYMCAHCEYLVPTEARRESHLLEEELRMVVGLHVGAGNLSSAEQQLLFLLDYLSNPYFYTSKWLLKAKTIFLAGENYKKPKTECASHLFRTLLVCVENGHFCTTVVK